MKIYTATSERDAKQWEEFALSFPGSSNYHRWGWKQVIERSFGWPTYYLMAEEDEKVQGILPLAWQKSWLFGSFITSLPFVNAGGIVAEKALAKQALLGEAIGLAQRLGAEYLELRHRGDHGLNLPSKTTKVAPVLPVEPNAEKMWQSLHHKVRTDIRKAMKSELVATFGGAELLSEFYEAFAENMRDLGTPVYSRSFFSEVLRAFPDETYICLLRRGPTPVATSFLIGFRDTVEAVWSASPYAYRSMKPNMFLYWQALRFAGERHYRYFDFGRSTIGSGTHKFKQQWGTTDVPLHWDYWLPNGKTLPQINPANPKYKMAIWLWQHLPLRVANWLGPKIVRSIP